MNARRWSILLVTLAVLGLTAASFSLSATRLAPRYDEVAYLALSRDVAREGGVVATVRCYLEGRCREDNRPPLFQFLVAPTTDDTPFVFARAKLVTHATALLLLAVVFLIVRRVFSTAVAVGSLVVLSAMPVLPDQAARVMHDPLYAALTFAAVYLMAVWQGRGVAAWLAVGAVVGLAFLTKGSGHLLLVPLVAVSLYRHGAAGLVRRPIVYAAACGFIAVAFFLMWRNIKLWGDPFYNINAREVWLEKWRDVWALQLTPEWQRVGLRWYLHQHTSVDLITKVGRGAGLVVGVAVYAAGVGFTGTVPRVVTGVAVLALGALGLRRRWKAGARVEVFAVLSTLAVAGAALCLATSGGPGPQVRYVFPYVVLVLPYSVHEALEGLWPWARNRLSGWSWIPRVRTATVALALTAALLVARLGLMVPAAWSDPRSRALVEPRWHEASLWLSTSLVPGERFAISFQSLYSTWDVPRPDTDPRWPFWLGMPADDLGRFMRNAYIQKLLVDTADPGYAEYADKLSTAVDGHGQLAFLSWPRCFSDGGRPSRFLIYCRP